MGFPDNERAEPNPDGPPAPASREYLHRAYPPLQVIAPGFVRDPRLITQFLHQASFLECVVWFRQRMLVLNPKTISASMFPLTELSVEILERILLCLPGQDIIRIEAGRYIIFISRFRVLNFPCMVQVSAIPGPRT